MTTAYKTITLLRLPWPVKSLTELERNALELKNRHEAWMETLGQQHPDLDSLSLGSQSLELAIRDLKESLPS